MQKEEPEIAIVGTKGQIVIPQQLRKDLKIKSKTKLAIYKRGDKLVVTKLAFPSVGNRLQTLFREIDSRYVGRKRPTGKEILDEIRALRKEKRSAQG
ncbi:MAG: AbrB/MazE/SpoVT family DNA-binding domain-containing protein [Nitrososphaerales archaeon]